WPAPWRGYSWLSGFDRFLAPSGRSVLRWYSAALPLGVFVLWQYVLYRHWGFIPFLNAPGNLGLPFAGFLRLGVLFPFTTRYHQNVAVEVVFILVLFALGALALRRAKASPEVKVCWLLYAGLAICFAPVVWLSPSGFIRALAEICPV